MNNLDRPDPMVAPPGVGEAAQVDVGRADELVPVPRALFLCVIRRVSHPDLELQSLLSQVPETDATVSMVKYSKADLRHNNDRHFDMPLTTDPFHQDFCAFTEIKKSPFAVSI